MIDGREMNARKPAAAAGSVGGRENRMEWGGCVCVVLTLVRQRVFRARRGHGKRGDDGIERTRSRAEGGG